MPTPFSDPAQVLRVYQSILTGTGILSTIAAGLAFVLCLGFIVREYLLPR